MPDAPQLANWTRERVSAMNRLAFARAQNRDLLQAEADARIDLAAAIMAMDETEDQPGKHNLVEQQAVNVALTAYGNALADLIRGETSEPEPSPTAILCGATPSASDETAVRAFAEALSQPTEHGRYLAILRLEDTEPARATIRDHDQKCCRHCGTHTMPHKGCILR